MQGLLYTLAQAADAAAATEPDVTTKIEEAGAAAGETAKQATDALLSGDVSTAGEKAWQLAQTYGIPALQALLILIVAFFVAKFVARLFSAPVRNRVDQTLGMFMRKLVFWSIMIFAMLGVLGKFGISVASFAAVLAAAGFAIGLAFQGTLGNFAAGVLLLVFRPFKVGDVINAAGITAKVYEIDLFTTTFNTPDNRRIIVPNSAIAGGTIENITFNAERRVDVVVGVEYSANIDQTREALTKAAESLKERTVQGEGRGYQVVLGDLGDSAVGWTVRLWCKTSDFWPTKEALTRAVKMHLDEAGIGIPFPQMDVHIDGAIAKTQ